MANPSPTPASRAARTRRSLADLDVTNFPLTNVDLTNFDVAAILASDPGRAASAVVGGVLGATVTAVREATYVTVGLTVLGFRRALSKRVDIERALRHSPTSAS
jgi:hypothetical protein